ncbi:MAG TPA: RNA polymerase sigma factor [Planctomycetota bacterium]|nr:RNA polymerase sigma factor [Planctomycetota bacterium]
MPAGPIADEDALRAVASGDSDAFGVVFERLAAPAYRYARRLLGDPAGAEDAVQESFVRLFAAARKGGFDPRRGTARGLLFHMVRNACVDRVRERAREGPGGEGLPLAPSPAAAADLREAIETHLASIPERQRSALLLRADAGLSYAEIAAALDASLAQVKSWIFRARRALAERLEEPALAKGGTRVV